MKRSMASAAVLAALVVAACGGGGTAADPGGAADPGTADIAADPGATDVADAADAGREDPGAVDAGPEAPGLDVAVPDLATDPGDDPGAADESPADPGSGDPGVADPGAPDPGAPDPGASDPGADAGPVTVQARPAVPADVVASYLMNASPAAWNLFGGDALPLGRHFDLDHVAYHSAVRFPGVAVPAGATILSAVLSFQPANEVDSSNILWLQVAAERSADSPPLSLSDYDAGRPDQRLRTDAKVAEWAIRCRADCTDLNEYDCPQRRLDCWDRTVRYACPKDLKALVQEVVDLPGWAAGHALTVLLDANVPQDYLDRDTGARHVTGVDPALDAATRPMLEITYR